MEADEQQVNLTRFSLFFPEKREFFLENQGMFSFGGVQLAGNFNNNQNESAPILFYSRRIGLNGPRIVPLEVGGRLTGRAGRYSIGVVNVQTDEEDESLPAPAAPDQFLGRAAAARRAAAEQRRRDRHGPIGGAERRRPQPGLRRRRHCSRSSTT